jgi:hypothetical protein
MCKNLHPPARMLYTVVCVQFPQHGLDQKVFLIMVPKSGFLGYSAQSCNSTLYSSLRWVHSLPSVPRSHFLHSMGIFSSRAKRVITILHYFLETYLQERAMHKPLVWLQHVAVRMASVVIPQPSVGGVIVPRFVMPKPSVGSMAFLALT